MYVPEGPCLRSLKSYLLHHKERRILEIKKTNLTKQKKNIKTRAQEKILTRDCGTTGRVLFYYYYWLTESCKTEEKKKNLKENVFKDLEE